MRFTEIDDDMIVYFNNSGGDTIYVSNPDKFPGTTTKIEDAIQFKSEDEWLKLKRKEFRKMKFKFYYLLKNVQLKLF